MFDKISIGFFVFCVLLFVFGTVGYVRNIVLLTRLDFKAPYKAEVVRSIGLFPVVGAITGWVTIKDN